MANLDNVKRLIAAGLAQLDLHQIDSKGLPAGATGVVTPGANSVVAARITAIKTFNVNIPDSEKVPVTGDNVLQGTFQFPSAVVRGFDMEFAEDDFADRDTVQGIHPVDIGKHTFAGRDQQPFKLNTCMFIATSNAKAQASGVKGLGMYSGVFSTRAEIVFRGRQAFAERAAASMLASVTLNAFDSYPWGQTFKNDASHEGYLSSFVEDWTFAYPVVCDRWTQTTGLTKFFLTNTPSGTTLNDVLVFVIDTNGTWNRYTSNVTVSTADNSINFSVAPTDAYDIVAWYGRTA